ADLVRLQVDVIVTWGTPAAQAAKTATSTIPIVMASIGDAVGTGLVTNLAHPGGNITGQSALNPELEGKRLELLKEAVPTASRLVLRTANAAPVWRGGMRCFSTHFGGKNWIHISAELC